MKLIVAALFFSVSAAALADQCQALSATMANRAALLIQPGTEIAHLCQPCGEVIRNAQVSVARSVRAAPSFSTYSEVSINGKAMDMAYTYVKVAPNKFVNVAKVIGCPARDVSPMISR